MRGRRVLSLAVVLLLLFGILNILLPVRAAAVEVGIFSVSSTHMRPAVPTVRAEQGTESVIVTAYNNGSAASPAFTVKIYYYNDTLAQQLIGSINFASIPIGESFTNATTWTISGVAEGAYWLKGVIDPVPGGDAWSGNNQKVSDYKTGIIRGHNVGVANIRGELPAKVRAGRDLYTINVDVYNNGYYDETNLQVTTYYNRSTTPATFVSINVTTISSLANRVGYKSYALIWNTTGLPEDQYGLKAVIAMVPGEHLDLDQDYISVDRLDVIRHDVSVFDVVAAPTGVNVGGTVQINATIQNQGVETESFNVKAYTKNATHTILVGTQAVSSLPPVDDRFRINQTVSPLTSWSLLRNWKDGLGTDTPPYEPVVLGTYSWDNQAEPNNGAWDWTDVSNIRMRFDCDRIGTADNFEVRIYEAWVVVNSTAGSFTCRPSANVISGISVTNPSYAYDANTNSYASFLVNADGYFELKTLSTGSGTINRVDIKIKYQAIKVVKVLTFNWVTPAGTHGAYTLNATADVVAGEILDKDDNSYENPDLRRQVHIPPVHDVAVTFAYTNQTYAEVGDKIAIYATVENQGDADETFTVRPYYKTTPAATAQSVSLARRVDTAHPYTENDTLKFIWDTTGVPLGSYNLWVVASTVGGETDLADNNRTAGRAVFTKVFFSPHRTIGQLSTKYKSWPSTYTATGVSVTNPANAYDKNEATYASFTTNTDGSVTFSAFNITAAPNIARVDFKIRYSAASVTPSGGADRFRLQSRVAPSGTYTTFQGFIDSNTNVPLATYEWTYRLEPNDGNWSWTDVSNIFIRFATDVVDTADNREIRVYEVWAEAYDKPYVVDLNVGGVEDLYAWSNRIGWDPTVIDVIDVRTEKFLHGGTEGTTFTASFNRTGNYVDLSETIIGSYLGVSGSGTIANVTLRIVAAGKSLLDLSQSKLINSGLQTMDHFAEDGKVNTVPLVGDIDHDGDVDSADLGALTLAYGSTPSKPNWNAAADLNGDLIIDVKDLRLLGKNWW